MIPTRSRSAQFYKGQFTICVLLRIVELNAGGLKVQLPGKDVTAEVHVSILEVLQWGEDRNKSNTKI